MLSSRLVDIVVPTRLTGASNTRLRFYRGADHHDGEYVQTDPAVYFHEDFILEVVKLAYKYVQTTQPEYRRQSKKDIMGLLIGEKLDEAP